MSALHAISVDLKTATSELAWPSGNNAMIDGSLSSQRMGPQDIHIPLCRHHEHASCAGSGRPETRATPSIKTLKLGDTLFG